MSVFGIDVSKWQTTTPDLASVEFLFARASIGTLVDDRYHQHIANARTAGIVTGAYHFNWDTISVAAQVAAFIAAAGDVDLYALDVEGGNAFSPAQSIEFIRLMHSAGLKCGLYHSASGFFDAGQDWDWIADYRSGVSHDSPGTFWQYTSGGSMAGYPGRLDFDRFNGTLAELYALAGKEVPMIPVAASGPYKVTLTIGVQLYDQAFKPLVKVSTAQVADGYFLTGSGYVATEVVTGGHHQLVFAKVSTVAIVAVTAPPDATACKPFSDAAVTADRAKAYVAYRG